MSVPISKTFTVDSKEQFSGEFSELKLVLGLPQLDVESRRTTAQ